MEDLKALRIGKGLSLEQVSVLTGYTKSNVSYAELNTDPNRFKYAREVILSVLTDYDVENGVFSQTLCKRTVVKKLIKDWKEEFLTETITRIMGYKCNTIIRDLLKCGYIERVRRVNKRLSYYKVVRNANRVV